jgi:hypothetical protein
MKHLTVLCNYDVNSTLDDKKKYKPSYCRD